ncbi:hypothetical protein DB346_15470 [Verrucomicrobia bacterium LW23]|nr:hypothetical protein DB346_15470 [Verrucomicrobia bacterium LW23]
MVNHTCRCTLAAFLLLVAGICEARARLGETLEQCVARYGTPVAFDHGRKEEVKALASVTFKKGNVLIMTIILQGKCVCILYSKRGEGDKIEAWDDDDLTLLREFNNNGKETWAPIDKLQDAVAKEYRGLCEDFGLKLSEPASVRSDKQAFGQNYHDKQYCLFSQELLQFIHKERQGASGKEMDKKRKELEGL